LPVLSLAGRRFFRKTIFSANMEINVPQEQPVGRTTVFVSNPNHSTPKAKYIQNNIFRNQKHIKSTKKNEIMKKRMFLPALMLIAGLLASCSGGEENYSLIPVKSGDQWGYINHKGEYVINPQFNDADFFREGLALVKSSDGKTGYIDEDGKYVIAAEYKDGTPFSEGLAFVVSDGGAPVCIDKSGEKKFTLEQAKRVYWFIDGLALFQTPDNHWGFIDKSGQVVINRQFEAIGSFPSEGLIPIRQNEKWGYADKNGNIVINPQFERASSFYEGKASFSNGKKYGFIDTKGNYIINPQFDNAYNFSDGLAIVKQGNKWGYVTGDGKIEINPQFDEALPFNSGMAAVEQGGSWGFIDKTGKIAINPQFDAVSRFNGNIALVKSSKQWGVIDKNGKYVVNPQYDDMKASYFSPKNELYFNVVSDFYDTSEFIAKFFERAGNNAFDGVNASTTLQNLLENATYGDGINADYNSQYVVNYKNSQKLTGDISISQVSFKGDSAFYSGSYYSKEYHFGTKVYAISYTFSLSGEARNKNAAITNALIAEIEKRYNIKLTETEDESGDSDYIWYEGSNEVFYFMLTPESDRKITLDIQFKQ
jgi:hypothetical protein